MSRRDDKVAALVSRAIPDDIRLSTNMDAQLVSSAITVVIGAMEDSERLTFSGQMADVHTALQGWFNTIFSEHVSKEEADCSVMAEKASRAMPLVTLAYGPKSDKRYGGGWRGYVTSDTRTPGQTSSLVWKQDETGYLSEYTIGESDDSEGKVYAGSGSSPYDAMRSAVQSSGAMLEAFEPNTSKRINL